MGETRRPTFSIMFLPVITRRERDFYDFILWYRSRYGVSPIAEEIGKPFEIKSIRWIKEVREMLFTRGMLVRLPCPKQQGRAYVPSFEGRILEELSEVALALHRAAETDPVTAHLLRRLQKLGPLGVNQGMLGGNSDSGPLGA